MISEYDYIQKNINDLKQKVYISAQKYGRKFEDINIVAVTKNINLLKINKILELGFKNLGENRVKEFCEKYDNIGGSCQWHMIGHLQTNKVKYIIDKVDLIHSLDSLELADVIDKRASIINRVINILVQVNISGEASKYGISRDQVIDFVKRLSLYKNLKVKGLMTIAPYEQDAENTRKIFRDLRKIYIDIKQESIDNIDMNFLSMGMSNDFEIAIEEGANIIRVGKFIFNRR